MLRPGWDFGDRQRIASGLAAAIVLGTAITACQRERPLAFHIVVPKATRATAVDGRVLVLLSTNPKGEPRLDMREPRQQITADKNTKQVYQLFGVDVDGLAPDASATVDAGAIGFPAETLAQVPAGDYTVQAVLNVYETYHRKDGHVVKLPADHWEGQVWRTKPGNLYSEPRRMRIDPASGGTVTIALDKEIPPLPYPKDTKYLKYVRIESALLTAFWGRKTELGAWVLLPQGFDEHPTAHYPLVVNPAHFNAEFQGSSGEIRAGTARSQTEGRRRDGRRVQPQVLSGLDGRKGAANVGDEHPACEPGTYDDSYAVNSENIGPYGDAITKELIPYVEKTFRGIGQPWSRMLTGCSTGGWEALGMQVFYPDFFNGTWVGAPSPIDLRAYTARERLRRQERVLVPRAVRSRAATVRRQPRHERHHAGRQG